MTNPMHYCGTLQLLGVEELCLKYFNEAKNSSNTAIASLSSRSQLNFNHQANTSSISSRAQKLVQWSDLKSSTSTGSFSSLSENNVDDAPLHRLKWATVPTFEWVVLASEVKVVILNLLENKQESQKAPVCIEIGEEHSCSVASVALWPVTPSRTTDPRSYDWSAVIVGTSDGVVRFFTDRGYFLTQVQYSSRPVVQIRVEQDELTVLYEDCYVIINGLTLLTVLKLHRQKIAKGAAFRIVKTDEENNGEILWKKMSLEKTKRASSVVATGIYKQSLWEQLTAATVRGGFKAYVAPHGRAPYDTYCATGTDNSPFLSFHWHSEPQASSVGDLFNVNALMYSAYSKLASGWRVPLLGASRSKEPIDVEKEQTRSNIAKSATEIFQRSALYDYGRSAQKIVISPCGSRLALVCDNVARVLMIDIRRRVILRVWTGFRDAQCGWLIVKPTVAEKVKKNGQKRPTILCAVIYAPKRGILSVWSTQNSRRIAAFNVCRDGLLLSSLQYPSPSVSKHFSEFFDAGCMVRFLDSNLDLFIIRLSFDLACETPTNQSFWNTEQRKELDRLLDNEEDDEVLRQLIGYVPLMKSDMDFTYLIDKIIKMDSLHFTIVAKFINAVVQEIEKKLKSPLETAMGSSSKQITSPLHRLHSNCIALQQKIDFYAMLNKFCQNDTFDYRYTERKPESSQSDGFPNSQTEFEDMKSSSTYKMSDELGSSECSTVIQDAGSSMKSFFDRLRIDESYFLKLCKHMDDNLALRTGAENSTLKQSPILKLKFNQKKPCFDLSKFLTCFEAASLHNSLTSGNIPFRLVSSLSENCLVELGAFIFRPFLSDVPVSEFEKSIRPIFELATENFVDLLCKYWLRGGRTFGVHPQRLYSLLFGLLSNDNFSDGGSDLEKALETGRRNLYESKKLAESVSLCLVLRAAAYNARRKTKDDSDGWETIEIETESWDWLLKMLYTRMLIETFMLQLKSNPDTLPCQILGNLNTLQTKGVGFAAEEIATYFVKECNQLEASEFLDQFCASNSNESSVVKDLREFFSFASLTDYSIATNCCWEFARRWHSQPTLEKMNNLLTIGLKFASLIDTENSTLQNGLYALIWQKFLRERLSTLCSRLDESANKRSTDKSFFERVEFGDETKTVEFCQACLQVCQALCQDRHNLPSAEIEDFVFEEFVNEFFHHSAKKSPPLIVVACGQKLPSKARLSLNYQMSIVMKLLVENFGKLPNVSPFDLFSESEEELFLDENQDVEIDEDAFSKNVSIDKSLYTKRNEFLKNLIDLLLDEKTDWSTINHETNISTDRSLLLKLADLWHLDLDDLRRYEVLGLCVRDRCDEAQRLTVAIRERQAMASDVSLVALASIRNLCDRAALRPMLTGRLAAALDSPRHEAAETRRDSPSFTSLHTCRDAVVVARSVVDVTSSTGKLLHEIRNLLDCYIGD